MTTLTHYRLCPFSRSVRMLLGELSINAELAEEFPWEWRPEFLSLNPAGDLPVLQLDDGLVLSGYYAISEYLAEKYPKHPVDGRSVPILPGDLEQRAEIRRLIAWFHRKFHDEVSIHLLEERLYRRFRDGYGQPPNADRLRGIRANSRYSLGYIAFLTGERKWLAGDDLSIADMAAAGHISTVDYLGEIDWSECEGAKGWYARMKSRPSMRTILRERVPGTQPPPAYYDDPDF